MKAVPALALLLSLTASAVFAQSAQGLFEKAYELIQQRDYVIAEALLRRGLASDPGNPLGHYYLARALLAQGKSQEEALTHYKETTRLSPESKEGIDSVVQALRIEAAIVAKKREVDGFNSLVGKYFIIEYVMWTDFDTRPEYDKISARFCFGLTQYIAGNVEKRRTFKYWVRSKGGSKWFEFDVSFSYAPESAIATAGGAVDLDFWDGSAIAHQNSIFRNLKFDNTLRGKENKPGLYTLPSVNVRLYPKDGIAYLGDWNKKTGAAPGQSQAGKMQGPHASCGF